MSVSEASVLIVEDEPLIADDLSFHLMDLGIKHITISLKYDDAINKITQQGFDLILLDVNLSGEKDGIDLVYFINRSNPTPFIFITSYYDGSTLSRAKQTNPLAYVLKPFDKQDITVNVEMALHKIANKAVEVDSQTDKFFIKDKEGLISISPDQINYVEAFDNYAKVFSDDQSFIISHTLKSVEDKLIQHGFVRVHKSYLVNFSRISMISEGYIFFGRCKNSYWKGVQTGFYVQDFIAIALVDYLSMAK